MGDYIVVAEVGRTTLINVISKAISVDPALTALISNENLISLESPTEHIENQDGALLPIASIGSSRGTFSACSRIRLVNTRPEVGVIEGRFGTAEGTPPESPGRTSRPRAGASSGKGLRRTQS